MMETPQLEEASGDLTTVPAEAIVNAWNRNLLPWWLLFLHGTAGAIRRAAGGAPFRELARRGRLAPGQAVLTGAGRLPLRGIIHVACIQPWSRSGPALIALAARNAAALAAGQGFASIAMPLLGAGSGGLDPTQVLAILRAALADAPYGGRIILVRYQPPAR